MIQDSFHPPHELCVGIQRYLADHESLYSTQTYSETAVVYSVETEFLRTSGRGIFADNRSNAASSEVGPVWQACETLAHAVQPYDFLCFPEGDLRSDTITTDALAQYRTILLPDCRFLTHAQSQLLKDYLEGEGRPLVWGELGMNLAPEEREAILSHPGTRRLDKSAEFNLNWLPHGPQVRLSTPADLAINLQRLEAGVLAVHLLRYDYNSLEDRVPALEDLCIDIRLPKDFQAYGVLRKVPLGAKVKVKATLSEATLANIRDVIRQPTGNRTVADPNGTLLVGAPGVIYSQVVLVGKGARATATGADATRTWTFHKCIPESVGEMMLAKGGELVAEVTWDVLYDESISAANKFFTISAAGAP